MGKFNYTLGWDRHVEGGPTELVNRGGNATAAGQWFGRTSVISDTAGYSVTISTALVNSDSIIFLTPQVLTYSGGAATFGGGFVVSTMSPGGFFKVQNTTSYGYVGSGWLQWQLNNPL